MRLTSINLNGLRSAAGKGVLEWLSRRRSDVVCMQEVKAQPADLEPRLLTPKGWHVAFHCAQRKGYSGVAIWSRREPDRIVEGIGVADIDAEGRFLRCDFGPVSVISLYLPSGSAGPHRQEAKFAFMRQFDPVLAALAREGREIVLCGDWNIAHREIDLKNWRSNRGNSGFLPEERAWIGDVFDRHGYVDVFRRLDPRPDQYTWWSNRGQAWDRNVGWRIDYHIATPGLAARATRAAIYKARRFSDHAPLTIDYDIDW